MIKYIIRRLIQAIPVIVIIAVLSFALMIQAPGGPSAQFNQNPHITTADVDKWLASWCLERSPNLVGTLHEFAGWFGLSNCTGGAMGGFLSNQGLPNFLPTFLGGGTNGILHGDFGYSISTSRPVTDLILERLPGTLILMFTAFIVWVTIAIIAGVIAAVKRYSLFDQFLTLFSYTFFSLPTFWLGLNLIFIFGLALRWFPVQGIIDVRNAPAPWGTPAYWTAFFANPLPQLFDIGRHLVLPVTTLVAVSIAGDSRFVRSAMLDVLGQDYVRTAKAKGVPQRGVIFRHAFRNALLPVVTNVALELAFLFSGAIVTETVFSWPGMGRLFIQALGSRDYFLLMGIVFIGSLLVVFFNLVADVVYGFVDPRVRFD
jgi:peptide/nickel transport system permease protein